MFGYLFVDERTILLELQFSLAFFAISFSSPPIFSTFSCNNRGKQNPQQIDQQEYVSLQRTTPPPFSFFDNA
jgi:hypothetical protein